MTPDYLSPLGDSDGQDEYDPGAFSAIPPISISFETLKEIFPDKDFHQFTFPLWVKLRDRWFRQDENNSSSNPLIGALFPLLSQYLQEKSPAQIICPDEVSRLCQAFQAAGIYQTNTLPNSPITVQKHSCQTVALNA